jgi:hypothetical protein
MDEKKLGNVLDKYKPEVAVIEDEQRTRYIIAVRCRLHY